MCAEIVCMRLTTFHTLTENLRRCSISLLAPSYAYKCMYTHVNVLIRDSE